MFDAFERERERCCKFRILCISVTDTELQYAGEQQTKIERDDVASELRDITDLYRNISSVCGLML